MSVKIVGLDESGQFEKRGTVDTRFVGGYTLVLDDEGENAKAKLKNEISKLLNSACQFFDDYAHCDATSRYSAPINQKHEISVTSKTIGQNEIINFKDIMESLEKKMLVDKDLEKLDAMDSKWKIIYPLSAHASDCVFFREEVTNESNKKVYKPYWGRKNNDEKVLYTGRPFVNRNQSFYLNWENFFHEYIQKVVLCYLKIKKAKSFCFMYPEKQIAQNDRRESNILNFTSGANLYEYMAQAAVMNEIMFYPEHTYGRYTLELATRSQKKSKMGDSVPNYSTGKKMAYITDKGTYRTAIVNMLNMLSWSEAYKKVQYDVDVESIKYSDYEDNNCVGIPLDSDQTPFHYLSDIVCKGIREKITQILLKQGSVSKTMIALAESQTDIPIEIRVLGEADLLYRRMIAALHEYKLADYYGYWYELQNLKDRHGYSDFYIEYWVKKKLEPMREEYMRSRAQANEIINYLPYGYEYAKNLIMKEEYEKSLFVAEKIREALQDNQNKNQKTFVDFFENASFLNLIRFRFNGIVLRGYNHRGEIDGAIRIIDECEKSASHVSPEEYLDFTVCTIQFFFNTFQYTKITSRYAPLVTGMNMKNGNSEQNSQQLFMNKSPLEQMSNILSEIQEQAAIKTEDKVPLGNMHMTVSGRIHSSLAQAYSFAQNQIDLADTWAEKRFNGALDIFSDDKGNRDITLCHYLHYLIMNGKLDDFELKSPAYFEEKTFDLKAYKKVIPGGRLRFAIYLYIKAFWKFYSTEKNRSLFEEILTDIKAVDEKFQKEHPWQLIYMNLYKIAKKYNMENELDGLRKKVHSCVEEKSFTVEMLNLNFELQCIAEENTDFDWNVTIGGWLEQAPDNQGSNANVTAILEKYIKYIEQYLKITKNSTFQDLKNALEKVCTYEYC